MLSLGTELFFAFWTASKRVGLPAGSPPPVRAATSMFLISLAKSLPRLASMTAFLCLVVAHLEWPLTTRDPQSTQSHHFAEVRVDPPVAGQFRMERRGEQVVLADGDDSTFGGPEGPRLRADLLHPR